MVFVATRAGASESEILDAATAYLKDERQVHADMVEDELARVRSFVRRYRLTGKANRAWLVFWNSSEAFVTTTTSNLVQALDPRFSDSRIRDFLELHYWSAEYTPRELLYYSTRRGKNPYRATANLTEDHRLLSYTCGHNPWLEARICRDIMVFDDAAGCTTVTWASDSLT
jgi:hypothetical protein